jgi:hypothetical protein
MYVLRNTVRIINVCALRTKITLGAKQKVKVENNEHESRSIGGKEKRSVKKKIEY